jgi:hypothetical protein
VYAASSRGELQGNLACDRAYALALENANHVCARSRSRVAVHGPVVCGQELRAGRPWTIAEIMFACEGSKKDHSSGIGHNQDRAWQAALHGANTKCAEIKEFIDKFIFVGCRKGPASVTCDILFECSISK